VQASLTVTDEEPQYLQGQAIPLKVSVEPRLQIDAVDVVVNGSLPEPPTMLPEILDGLTLPAALWPLECALRL
jgi:hypothetical protein